MIQCFTAEEGITGVPIRRLRFFTHSRRGHSVGWAALDVRPNDKDDEREPGQSDKGYKAADSSDDFVASAFAPDRPEAANARGQ